MDLLNPVRLEKSHMALGRGQRVKRRKVDLPVAAILGSVPCFKTFRHALARPLAGHLKTDRQRLSRIVRGGEIQCLRLESDLGQLFARQRLPFLPLAHCHNLRRNGYVLQRKTGGNQMQDNMKLALGVTSSTTAASALEA